MTSEKVGRYEVEQKLGQGGMASVFLARDPFMKRQVAVKVLPREFMADPQFRARFQREAEIIASLEHAHIVPVYDFGQHENQPYIVMRYMTGRSLEDRLIQRPLSLDDTINTLIPVAEALDYAHSRGVVHRDLKPANIMFDGQDDPFITDFGIARLAAANTRLTRTGIMGTPAYMSPEQWRGGTEVIDGRADIYALGIMVFEMLSGELPFEVDTPAQMMYRHLTEPPARLLEKMPRLPTRCEAVITRALAKDRDARYSTATELVKALKDPTKPYRSSSKLKLPISDEPKPNHQLPSAIEQMVEIVDTGRLAGASVRADGPARVYVPHSQRNPDKPISSEPPPPSPVRSSPPVQQKPSPLPTPRSDLYEQTVMLPEKPQGSFTTSTDNPQRYLWIIIPGALALLCALITVISAALAIGRMYFGQ